jgi:hypothetical protein
MLLESVIPHSFFESYLKQEQRDYMVYLDVIHQYKLRQTDLIKLNFLEA